MNEKPLTNKQLATVALYLLHGDTRSVDTEDLAMKMVALAPGRFHWRKYPDQINIELIRASAADLLKQRPPLAVGGVRYGWMLTPAGVAWCQQGQIARDEMAIASEREIHLRHTDAYRKYASGQRDAITVFDVRRVLQVDEYTSKRRHREQQQLVENVASRDSDMEQFVRSLRAQFVEEWK